MVSGAGANLEVLGPCDLAELPGVNRAKERLVREWSKDTAAHIASEVDHALHAVGKCQAKTVSWKRPDIVWSVSR